MKLVIRTFAMFVVFVGLAAASVSSGTPPVVQSHFAATAGNSGLLSIPLPPCPLCQ
jgi:hypothetical protein